MCEQQPFELGGRHLESLVLDELIDPVGDEEVPVDVHPAEIAGVEPAVAVDGRRGRGRVVEIPGHHLRTAHPQLALDVVTDCLAGGRVDDQRFGVRREHTDRPGLPAHTVPGPRVDAWRRVRNGRQLRHPVPLHDLDAEPVAQLDLLLGRQRRGRRHDATE